jgi:starch-binding outer membrane protein, SusD/RagB family
VSATAISTLQVVLDSCISDLKTARDLLAATDTSAVLKAVEDPFTSYTQNHLNYWAVSGLLARVYLYKGDTENAEEYARAVISSSKFPLITSNVAAVGNVVRDRTFSQELLFAVYSTNIKTNNNNLFNKSAGTPLQLTTARRNAIYVSTSGSNTDYRFTSWFDVVTGGSTIVPSKFFQDANLPYALQNIVPVIRASEMYYIAAECAVNKNDINTGVAYLNKVRQARGLNILNAAGISNTDSVSKEIMREHQKEFIQEGQTFYYYKRLNKDLKQVTSSTANVTPAVYVLPLPDKEKEYNP